VIFNELAQWAVLISLAVFVFGLTRQLGHFLVHRQAQIEDLGPDIGKPLPASFVKPAELAEMTELMQAAGSSWAPIIVVDENCHLCERFIEALDEDRYTVVPRPLFALVKQSNDKFEARIDGTFDFVVSDSSGERSSTANIIATPFVMIIDAEGKLLHKRVAADPYAALIDWMNPDPDAAEGPFVMADGSREASTI
jgi:hypothetical protein